ncbi:hypothetical protein HH214_17735 [Mucilaginibacter robiniae]|uniref:Uncharacterized protein n=1 Tax=Mucilaginibacter robiniae TaxID=2728022 RepID=A0A7L5E715_9SPHI|nr:DUF6580 family putative transport protein [Mucilaginibacter robiniae]QJD97584.1 hypothetical protein HH214_17735 [Mucilaginibacter robiniae]
MSLQRVNLSIGALLLVILAFIISTGAMRLVSFNFWAFSNFTPLGAMALFTGAYFNNKFKAALVLIATLFITDIFINYLYTSKIVWFNTSSLWLYASFMIMILIGSLIKKVNITNVLLASLASVAVHWLLTDIDPWLHGNLYAKGLSGYGESLFMALPFERNMLLADAAFGAVLFGGFELIKGRWGATRYSKPVVVSSK